MGSGKCSPGWAKRAATTDLPIEVWVKDGVAFLRGRVPGIEDAEEVAGRLPEVRNVVEQLEITEGLSMTVEYKSYLHAARGMQIVHAARGLTISAGESRGRTGRR